MSKREIRWCTCENFDKDEWKREADFYALHFVPRRWKPEYTTLEAGKEERFLYLVGKCNICGGYMRSGVGIAMDDRFLASVYREMQRFRPYDRRDRENDLYFGCVPQRAKWYQNQDLLISEDCDEQFLQLFQTKDRPAVRDWLSRRPEREPDSLDIKRQRDRKSTLLQKILCKAREDGCLQEAEKIMDCTYENDDDFKRLEPDTYLTDYKFVVSPSLVFTPHEGIRLILKLQGRFDSSKDREHVLAVFMTRKRTWRHAELWVPWAAH